MTRTLKGAANVLGLIVGVPLVTVALAAIALGMAAVLVATMIVAALSILFAAFAGPLVDSAGRGQSCVRG